jgi:hypothetical protein
MNTENLTPPSVVDMIIITATNNAEFMKQVAGHIQDLEATIVQLQTRIAELEGKNGTN